jgi:hypothetical protein
MATALVSTRFGNIEPGLGGECFPDLGSRLRVCREAALGVDDVHKNERPCSNAGGDWQPGMEWT